MAGRPYVLLSVAMSADGYIDDATSARLVLSDQADLDRVDELRAGSDAILVGAQTIRTDNPRLLVRSAVRRQRRRDLGLTGSPQKVTITGSGNLDPRARFFTEAESPPLVYAYAGVAAALAGRLTTAAVVIAAQGAADLSTEDLSAKDLCAADLDLAWILADLGARGISRLLVEGGAVVLGQFLTAGLADEFVLAIAPVFVADRSAPRLLAGRGLAGRMQLAEVAQFGDVAVLRYRPAGKLRD